MKTKPVLVFASVLVLYTAFLLPPPAAAQREARTPQKNAGTAQRDAGTPQKDARTTQGGDRTAQNRPRANQGHIPKVAPPVRSNPDEQPQAEHLPTGHVNDMPHVSHDQWFGHEQSRDARFHMDQPFSHGRFAHMGPQYRYRVTRIKPDLHRFWFSNGYFEVAEWDWPLCADWCWNCGDDFVVYDDPDHPGWNLLYNVHTGVYVHVRYMGR